jgi:MFS family permease
LSAQGSPGISRRGAVGLGLLFGALAFCQGVAEPSDGLIAQPSWSLLKRWGHGPGDLGAFSMGVGLVWVLKPVFGLVTDFVPLFGRRRRNYLILAGALAAASMFAPAILHPPSEPSTRFAWLLGWLALATLAWSFADVVADALLIDRGRPSGLVGQFQAAQWAAAYLAGIVAGVGGGWLSQGSREHLGFWLCGLAATGTMLLASFAVRETRVSASAVPPGGAFRALARAVRSPKLLAAGAFLFLWNFNPFSTVVFYLHTTRTLGLDEDFYGMTQSVWAVGSILGCLAYPSLARWVAPPSLVRVSIVLGVASTLTYAGVSGRGTAVAASLVVGLIYMVATLIQLDLAARACPPEAAGTCFALLMALENLAASLSTGLGGWAYDKGGELWGLSTSFSLLVLIGAAFTASSWLLLPGLSRVEVEAREPGPD